MDHLNDEKLTKNKLDRGSIGAFIKWFCICMPIATIGCGYWLIPTIDHYRAENWSKVLEHLCGTLFCSWVAYYISRYIIIYDQLHTADLVVGLTKAQIAELKKASPNLTIISNPKRQPSSFLPVKVLEPAIRAAESKVWSAKFTGRKIN